MQSEITSSSETAETAETRVDTATQLTSLSELLSEDNDTSRDDPKGEAAGDGDKEAKPVKLLDLERSTDLDADALYALQVTKPNGETVTVGELKDLASKQDDMTLRELEWEEQRSTQEGELRKAQNELTELIAQLPKGVLKPEVLADIRQRHEQLVQTEQTRTLEVIPEWRDDQTREQDIAGMVEHLQSFGFPANYLASVVDHRQLAFIRSAYLREQRVKLALQRVRAGTPNPTTPTKGVSKAPSKAPPQTRTSHTPRNPLEAFLSKVE